MEDQIIDSIASAMASQATGRAIERVKEALSQADDEREAWNEIARTCATYAKMAHDQHIRKSPDSPASDTERSRGIARSVGEVAHVLAIQGEERDYDEDDVQLVSDLAQACAKYSSSPTLNHWDFEDEYKEAVDELSEQIFEMADT